MNPQLIQSRQNLLLNESRRLKVMHDLILRRYAFERFLVRLGESKHRESFVLKGAMALIAVTGSFDRPTRDMDMLGLLALDAEEARVVLAEIAATTPSEDDGLRFDVESFTADIINAATEEPGTKVTGYAYLGSVRIPLKIEISHGHLVTPHPVDMEYPTVLGGTQSASILCYTKETMLAEKFEAVCSLGTHTSRFKDFYDIRELSRKLEFDGSVAAEAFRRTFAKRETAIPAADPVAFDVSFREAGDRGWKGFLRKQGIRDEQSFADLVEEIRPFVMGIAAFARGDQPQFWSPDEGWAGKDDATNSP